MLNKSLPGTCVRLIVITALCLGALFPLYFLIVTSFKTQADFGLNYFLPPHQLDWANIRQGGDQVLPYVWNSVRIALATAVIVLLVVVPAAYAFTWHKFPGKEKLFAAAIGSMMIPAVLTFVPQFILIRQLGLLNTDKGVVLPFVATNIALAIYLLRSFFSALPVELIEAARCDGANDALILSRIVLPLTVPSLVTIAVLTIVSAWNSFLWPLVAITTQSKQTVSVAVTLLASDPANTNFPLLCAGYLVASLPLIIIMSLLLRFFVRGLTAGAVKG